MNMQPDDPRLSAWVLGELDDEAARAVEEAVAADPVLAAEVESLRAVAIDLGSALAGSGEEALTDAQRSAVLDPPPPMPLAAVRGRRLLRVGLGVAALLTITVGTITVILPALNLPGGADQDSRVAIGNGPPADGRSRDSKLDDRYTRYGPAGSTDGSGRRAGEAGSAPDGLASPETHSRPAAGDDGYAFSAEHAVAAAPHETLAAVDADQLQRGKPQPASVPEPAMRPPPAPPRASAAPAGGVRDSSGAARISGGGAFSTAPASSPPVLEDNVNGVIRYRERGRTRGGLDGEGYTLVTDNDFDLVSDAPLSTFGADVDTASYANLRRYLLREGALPPAGAVRIEEMLNYFAWNDAPPAADDERPFAVHIETGPCAWQPEHTLVRIGVRGRDPIEMERPSSNLVFLLDVSGSMRGSDKLPLLKRAMKLLVNEMNGDDRIAIVTYASGSGVALPSTLCSEREKPVILAAIDALSAGGSTNAESGIELAYETARQYHVEGGINRVMLGTDGDFNVGISQESELLKFIEAKRDDGVSLSVLGFGTGNLQDGKMEVLADHGNGNYAYIDSIDEGRKVLVEEMGGTLQTIARDLKLQVDFNPQFVAAYRLIGYENRMLEAQDFNDDTKDAGDIGAGHSVTALYELVPPGAAMLAPKVDPSKYAPAGGDDAVVETVEDASDDTADAPVEHADELLTVRIRYKAPDGGPSTRFDIAVPADAPSTGSDELRFASAVASFGMILRDSPHRGSASYALVQELLQGPDAESHRAAVGFLRDLVRYTQAEQGELAIANARALAGLALSDDAMVVVLCDAGCSAEQLDETRRFLHRSDELAALAARLTAPTDADTTRARDAVRRAEFATMVEHAAAIASPSPADGGD